MRTRIKVTLETSKNGRTEPIELHDQVLNERENRYVITKNKQLILINKSYLCSC